MDEFPVIKYEPDEILEEEEYERLYAAPIEIVALLSIFYGVISIVAVVGNGLVIWVVATTRQMRTVTNMYIANLALADVVIGLFCIPFQFQAALLQRWNLPWFMCGFCPFVQALSVNVSVFTLTAIAIDRHRAIINPLRARPTKFSSKIIIGAIWVVSFTFAIPCAIAFRVEIEHERYRDAGGTYNVSRPFCMNKNLSEDQLQTYRYTLVFVQYLVPFCVISFVYIQMAVKLWGTQTPGNAQDTRDITLLRNKKKVIKMLIIVVIVFGLCWLPLQLYNILYVTIPEINEYHFISIVWFTCDWLAMSNSCYNPFIYGIYNEKFKREFNKRFSACFCKFQTSLDQQERTFSMHTRASSVRSTYASSSMRVRNTKPLTSFNSYRVKSNLNCGPAVDNSHRIAKRDGNGNGNGEYNMINLLDDNGNAAEFTQNSLEGGRAMRNAQSGVQWRRNNFKPINSDVTENEDDVGEFPFNGDKQHSPNAIQSECLLARNGSVIQHQTSASDAAHQSVSSNCICEQELASSVSCDGTCILSEVSRVQVPTQRPEQAISMQSKRNVKVVDFKLSSSQSSSLLSAMHQTKDEQKVPLTQEDNTTLDQT